MTVNPNVELQLVTLGPRTDFAAAAIRAALAAQPSESEALIRLTVAARPPGDSLAPEGFAIVVDDAAPRRTIDIRGADTAGLMYGGLEVAEIIRTRGLAAVAADRQEPALPRRGVKFNLCLDVRTPTYSEPADAAQINMAEMWSLDFWQAYIDQLAGQRYNFVSLWSLHPFPSLVRVPGYEDIALADVWRSKRISAREGYSLRGTEMLNDDMLADVTILKRMSIDDKIDFWQQVMAYGKTRNVDFYLVTWNIFTFGTFGRDDLDDRADNPVTIDYFRRSVATLFRTYPDLAGVGLTTGENMPGLDAAQKEDWAFATYGQGVLDVAREQPERHITFLHRQHESGAADIAARFQPLIEQPNVEFLFSFKYAQAHVMSSTRQPFHVDFAADIGRQNLQTIWTLRNDSNYYFRWGAPDFVREFMRNLPPEVSNGVYYGSDGYHWGRDFLSRQDEEDSLAARPLEIERHWYHWLLWGRLAYDPNLNNERLQRILAERFALPDKDALTLLQAWQSASLVYPAVTGFHWGALDFQWYIEACQSRPGPAGNETGFHDVEAFINQPVHPESGTQPIPAYVAMHRKGGQTELQTPLQVAESLTVLANTALEQSLQIEAAVESELAQTLSDIQTMASLGLYYAAKIRGATEVALFRATDDQAHQTRALGHLKEAALAWAAYAERALARYKNPLWTNRVNTVDWRRTYTWVLEDIRQAGGDPELLGLPPQLEADNEAIDRQW